MARYRLLDEFYEREHRGRLTEDGQVRVWSKCTCVQLDGHAANFYSNFQEIPILRPRTHDGFQLMRYDDRYTPLLRRAGLHTVANLLRRGMPVFNPAALTALVDRCIFSIGSVCFRFYILTYVTNSFLRVLLTGGGQRLTRSTFPVGR